jgi:hypothetical protein
MVRVYAALIFGLALAAPLLAQADSPLAGTFKVVIPTTKGSSVPWLIKLEPKDGKWTGAVLATGGEGLQGSAIEDVAVAKDLFGFKIKTKDFELRFEGKLPKGKEAKIPLSFTGGGGDVSPAVLEQTTLTTLDRVAVLKELVAKQEGGHEVVQAALGLLSNAAKIKAKPEEVRAWADKAVRSAETYGPLWHRQILIDVADFLGRQDGFADIALEYAQKAEGQVEEKDTTVIKKKVLTALATALEKAGKTEEAKKVQARNDKIPYFTVKKYAGRKGKSDRIALVELFTSDQDPSTVASSVAFDALQQTYTPSEVVLLQYFLNPGQPDPLATPDTVARVKFYENLRELPTAFFNGKKPISQPGDLDASSALYDQFNTALAPLLEEKPRATIKLSATQKAGKIDIKADVSDLAETGPDIRLRLVLVEEKVAFSGPDKLPAHYCVVRTFPGGPAGTVLKEKTFSKTVTVDLDAVRKTLTDYVEKNTKDAKLPNKDKLVELKKLRVVAFVQNDESSDVMQAAQVEVAGE